MKFLELGLSDPQLRPALDEAYRRVMDSGWVVLGPEVAAFESEFAAWCGADHAIGVGNGLDAITLALRAADIGPGHEVIVPSHTYAATWVGVAAAGAAPVPAEVDPATCVLDPAAAAAAITARTAAILPVSLYGHPCDMDALRSLADRHGLFLLEDAAQGHGARCRGRRVGSLAHATAFSFYPTKNLGAVGDAGAVLTDDPALAARLRRLRNYGQEVRYVNQELGANSRLDELQAAFLRAQLPRLEAGNAARRAHAARYAAGLSGIAELELPVEADWAEAVYHLYVIRAADRDRLQADLAARGVETLVHYPVPCHLQPAFAHLGHRQGAFPVAESLSARALSLPLRPAMTSADIDLVARAVADSLGAGA